HLTVGTATALTFMCITYWLVPHLTRRPLYSNRLALWASWLWFTGMMAVGLGMHCQGPLALPRRSPISHLAANLQVIYADTELQAAFMRISGVILYCAAICYFSALFAILFSKRKLSEAEKPKVSWVKNVRIFSEAATRLIERRSFWLM